MAQASRTVQDAIAKKLGGVTDRAVRLRRERLQAAVSMPNDTAMYVLAQRLGLPVHRWVKDAETLQQVAYFAQQLDAKDVTASAVTPQPERRSSRPTTTVKEFRLEAVKVPEAALTPKRMAEAERMAKVYPMLYAFENSMREVIDGHLTAAYGDSWSDDPKIVNADMRKIVQRNSGAEARHRYHSARTARFIYYTDIGHLPVIVQSENGWKVFKRIFPSDRWLAGRVEPIETSRNVVAHMNPLKKRDIDRIKLNFEDWLDQIKGHEPPSVA